MPALSDLSRRKLKFLPRGGNAPQNPGLLACWNWALSGFGPNEVNPDTAFSYVSGDLNQAGLLPVFQQPENLARLTNLRAQWVPHDGDRVASNQATAAFNAGIDGIVKISIEVNGLRWSNRQTPYQLCMYYEDGLDGSGYLRAPNYTHWWLKIDGGGHAHHNDGIESFPGSAFITIRRPEYSNVHVYRIYLESLHRTHVTRIDDTLQYIITSNHALLNHGVWTPDNARTTCQICNENFGLFNRKHHCRCCGSLVCGSCSPNTRIVVARVQHPNGNDGVGAQRVCMYCE